ncbi:hypothetical protein LJC42_07780 [Eubacteriales bacterium OttesenSCG-928-K08]|nr:hypothetical protein [Eubacteriales bacterium OttesenSCG-928-K08]
MEKTTSALAQTAYALFEEFRCAYAGEWQRLNAAERMYCGDHWHDVPQRDPDEPRPTTPIIQSTVENIAADMMDSLPEAIITPETPQDNKVARVLEAVIRQNHDAACYEREYRALVHDLLVGGYAVQEVGYDPALNGGLGGAFIRHTDNRSILFDPLCTDFADGRAVFKFATRTIEWLRAHFPNYNGAQDGYKRQEGLEDELILKDSSKTALLIEYWWREYDAATGRYKVHMAQLAGGQLLSDSRRTKPEGYFAHGMYPFLVTPLYTRKGSPLGYGIVDMFADQQKYADKLDQIMLKNALMASHNKLLITEASGFDPSDLRDWAKDVHVGESLNGVSWFSTPPLPAYIMQYINNIRNSIKEESGANDFSRGGAAGGITAASAIAALQEMSSKRSRMAIRQMHESYRDAVRMEIEVEREFNILPRYVTISVNGEQRQEWFDGRMLERSGSNNAQLPIEFAISIKVQKENRWSVLSQNELVLQMLNLGVLQPAQAVELMHFDGKEQVLQSARQQAQQQGDQPEAAAPFEVDAPGPQAGSPEQSATGVKHAIRKRSAQKQRRKK